MRSGKNCLYIFPLNSNSGHGEWRFWGGNLNPPPPIYTSLSTLQDTVKFEYVDIRGVVRGGLWRLNPPGLQ